MFCVTDRKHYLRDSPQGGVEVPYMLVFQGDSKYVDEAKSCYWLLKGLLTIKPVMLVKMFLLRNLLHLLL